MTFIISGRIREQENGDAIQGLLVRAIDKDLLFSDLLGTATTDAEGRFKIIYEESDFREIFDSRPDIYLSIYAPPFQHLMDTRETVRWGASEREDFELKIPRAVLQGDSTGQPDRGIQETFSEGVIGAISVSRAVVDAGESARVKVEINEENTGGAEVDVRINGVIGSEQYLQFHGRPGLRTIHVSAVTSDRRMTTQRVQIRVAPTTDGRRRPVLSFEPNIYRPLSGVFRLEGENLRDDGRGKKVYLWNFGNGRRVMTTQPFVVSDFSNTVEHERKYTQFDVTVSVAEPGRAMWDVGRTLAVWSTDHLSKQLGYTYLTVIPDPHVVRNEFFLTGKYEIKNHHHEPVRFTSFQRQLLSTDPEQLCIPFASQECDITVDEHSSAEDFARFSVDEIPKDADGFAIHLKGETQSGLRAYASAYFEFRRDILKWKSTPPRLYYPIRKLPDWDIVTDEKIWLMLEQGLIKEEVVEPVTELLTVTTKNERETGLNTTFEVDGSLIAAMPGAYRNLFESRWRDRVERLAPDATARERNVGRSETGRESQPVEVARGVQFNQAVNLQKGASRGVMSKGPGDAGVESGKECDPDNLPDNIPKGFSCQLTSEVENRAVPGRIVNARKGDIILSPADDGLIGLLLKQVVPPQRYSHTGIMTSNYYEITHSTSSQSRMKDHSALVQDSDKPTDGFDPNTLKYQWPGTVTQTVDNAFKGEEMPDPDTIDKDTGKPKTFNIGAFRFTKIGADIGGHWELVEPLVIKPAPALETVEVRKNLHKLADAAKAIKGHYRFFCYTDAAIGLGTGGLAPASTGQLAGTRPTCCSSLIWLAAKDSNLQLESPNEKTKDKDLEQSPDKVAGAQVDSNTRDGLYLYTAEERAHSAEWMHDFIHDAVEQSTEDATWFPEPIITLFTDMPDDVANQIVNTFASDWADEDAKDSDKWKNPGDGHAVSPDNLLFWDAPTTNGSASWGLYGYAEPLIYRMQRYESVEISRWKKTSGEAKITVHVTYKGNPVAEALVTISGQELFTDANGNVTFTVNNGSYLIKASKVIDELYCTGKGSIDLKPDDMSLITIELKEPPELYREVVIQGSMHIVDEETIGDETADRSFARTSWVGPYGTHDVPSPIVEKMGGEVRIELHLSVDWNLDLSVKVSYTVLLFEGTSEDTGDLDAQRSGEYIIPKDGTVADAIFKESDEFSSADSVNISITMTNSKQKG
jgi:hypothetical protein